MKITLVSDLHLEFGYQTLPGGEVLILAGDICEAKSFTKEFHSTRLLDTPSGTYPYYDFFYTECAKYDRVFYVMGNHEHYHGRFDRTYHDLRACLPSNVRLLENEFEEYNGVIFLGATLWTDLNKGNPLTMHTVKYGMNDYRVIKNHYVNKDIYYKLTPEHTIGVHRDTKNFFRSVLKEKSDHPVVVISHHAPTLSSIHPRYKHDMHMNGGYASDLSGLILDCENIRVWVHGHTHEKFDYVVGNTRVISNPRGYFNYEDTSNFDPGFSFEII
jgi:predicted phosphodiesterase